MQYDKRLGVIEHGIAAVHLVARPFLIRGSYICDETAGAAPAVMVHSKCACASANRISETHSVAIPTDKVRKATRTTREELATAFDK